jgi:hypothetical protein
MKFWKQKISYFIERHPIFMDTEEEIFTPRQDIKVRFWFDGNLQVEGLYNKLEINYNDSDLLILATEYSIYRIPWNRLIGFEIIIDKNASKETLDLIKMSNLHKN